MFTARSDDPLEPSEDIYRFTYQHFSDHLIVEALLREHTDVSAAFQAGGAMRFLLEHEAPWELGTLWSALAIWIPEEHPGLELLDLIPEDQAELRAPYYLEGAFKQSIVWRASSAFSEHTLELFNKMGGDFPDPRLDILIRLATLQDHPWNAQQLLDPFLQRLIMPDRDAFWTVEINTAAEDGGHPIWILVRWCLKADLLRAETETLRLAATALCWLFTSSNRRIRDAATKALTAVITAQPAIYPNLLLQFVHIDDLYVGERVCAAGFGAVCRGIGDPDLREISHAVYEAVFLAETPPPNINLRDYARGIIEYAAMRSSLHEQVDLDRCRPPYSSTWPLEDTTEEELARIAEEVGSTEILSSGSRWGDFARYEIEPKIRQFSAVPLGEPRPLNDEEKLTLFKELLPTWSEDKQRLVLELERRRSVMNDARVVATASSGAFGFHVSYAPKAVKAVQQCEAKLLAVLNDEEHRSYEHFAIPTFFPDRIPSADRDLERFDESFSKRWVTRRAYKYGWTTQLFPSDRSRSDISSLRPLVERIGKKYQWLALSELLARLSDNVWAIEEWPDRAQIYDHPAHDWFVRDIEPSVLVDPPADHVSPRCQAHSLDVDPVEDTDLAVWPFRVDPPNSPDWLDASDPDGQNWLLLYGLFACDERREEATPAVTAFRRQAFVRVSSIIIKSEDVDKAMQQLRGARLSDPTDHDTVDWTDGPFLCEYPWRNTWSRTGDEAFDEGFRSLRGLKYIRPVIRHVWESQLDVSLSEGARFCLPHPWIGRRMGLRPNLQRPGEVVDGVTGNTVFMDPYRGSSGRTALVNEEKFFQFLRQENLECLWFVAGERNSYPSGQHGDFACRYFGSVYKRREGAWIGRRWHEDQPRTR